jgi:LysM repeat protein
LRRLVFFLAVNAVVSVVVTLSVLWIWEATHPATAGPPVVSAGTDVPDEGAAPASTPAPGDTAGAPPEQAATPEGSGGGPPGLATITPTVYVVQPGDTLGSIADRFAVSVEDLMAANGLTDPNVLDVGQTLNIPFGDFLPPTLTPEPPTEAPIEPTSAEGSSNGTAPVEPTVAEGTSGEAGTPQLAIRGVIGAGETEEERVTVVNVGGDVSLAGWTLHDDQGNVFFFPALSLFQGGAVTVHTKTGQNTVTDLYWNQSTAIWETGETATLVDPTGADHTTFVVP